MQSRVFLITGVSSGLGRAFAEAALADGHRVIGTVRRAADADAFRTSERAVPLQLDVTDYASIPDAAQTGAFAGGKSGPSEGGASVLTLFILGCL